MEDEMFQEFDREAQFNVIYPKDWELANSICDRLQRNEDAIKRGEIVKLFANRLAAHGQREMEQRVGFQVPRHAHEIAKVEFQKDVITKLQFKEKYEAADEQKLDETLLKYFVADMEGIVEHYGKLLTIVGQIELDQHGRYPPEKYEPLASFHARECLRGLSFSKKLLNDFCETIEEIRAKKGITGLKLGEFGGNCAFFVWVQVVDHAAQHWFNCVEIAHRSQTEPNYLYATTASHLFFEGYYDELPRPQALMNLIYEEELIVKCALKEKPSVQETIVVQAPPVNVYNNVDVSPTIQVGRNDSELGDVQHSKSKSMTKVKSRYKSKSNGYCRPKLSKWAVGLETSKVWWLYYCRKDQWQQYGKVSIPAGYPQIIMELLAEHGGVIDKEDAIKALCNDDPRILPRSKTRRVTDALSKAKTAIRECIARTGRYKMEDVPNPIPNESPGWRARIQIGYAILDDHQKLKFTLKEDRGLL